MRKIDVIWLGLALVAIGFGLYAVLSATGLSQISAGIWSQGIFMLGLLAWVGTYLFRVITSRMTFNEQRRSYREAWLNKRRADAAAKRSPESSNTTP